MSSFWRGPETMTITALSNDPAIVEALAMILVDTVAGGGSVSFMHPLPQAEAVAFWQKSLSAAERGERIVLGAWLGDDLAGTITVLLDCPPNQPHRAEIAKLMVAPRYRGRGLARALLVAAEMQAVLQGRTLLVLDTATDGGAMGLYESQGFTPAGIIPDYALKPHGGLTGTMFYWKRLMPVSPG